MKKTLATLLVVALVASLCGVMFVSAEETNIALGKEVLNAGKRGSYYADLTDGVALDSLTYNAEDWFGFYWNPGMDLEGNTAQQTNAIDGIAKPTVDLGATASIDKVRVNLFDGSTSGIVTPESITLKVSTDGETYTDIDVKSFEWPEDGSKNVIWVEFALETAVDARYVQREMKMRTTFVFINEIEVYEAAKAEAPSTGATNLVAGKTYTISEQFHMSTETWGYDESYPVSYPDDNYELTDGLIAEAVYSEAGWMGFNQQTPAQAERGYAFVTFDLGAVCDLDSFDYVNLKNKASGIQPAHTVEIYVSNDGENYELAGTKKFETEEFDALADDAAHKISIALDVSARYVQMRAASYGWNFLGEVEILGTAAGNDKPATNKTYENTYVVTEKTNDDGSTEKVASVEVPYGYTWTIDDVDGKIGGEDATICTTQDAYNACNPNWAITLYVEKQADGTYVALRDAIVCPGSAENAGIEVGGDKIAIVIHSASSNPDLDAQYGNWMGKIVAVSVKAGDVFKIADDMTTVYAVVPGEGAPSTGDAGVLVFVVLAVVAVAGVAVVSKAKKAL